MRKFNLCFIFVLTGLLVCGLFGCGTRRVNTIKEYNDAYDGSEVNVVFYHTMGSNLSDVLKKYIKSFNAIYPNIKIEESQVGSYDDVRNQNSTELAAGKGCNISYCYADHVALYNTGNSVVVLDSLINNKNEIVVDYDEDGNEIKGIMGFTEEQIADFIPGYYNEGKQLDAEGHMYMLPFSKSTEVLYYNKTFFTNNNLSVPDHWFSSDDNDTTSMEYVCRKIKEIDKNSIPLGYDSDSNWFITMCEQNKYPYTSLGDDNFLFDNAENKALWKKFRTWYRDGLLTTQALNGNSYTSGLFTSTSEIKSYMSIGSSAGATHQRPEKGSDGKYPFEVGIVPIPQCDQNNKKVICQGPSVCIFNKENDQEVYASWLFLKYLLTNVSFQAEFSSVSGYVPVLQSVKNNKTYAEKLDKADGGDYIAYLSAKVCLEQASYYYTSPAFIGSSDARDQVGALVAKVLAGDTEGDSVDKFIDKAFKNALQECLYSSGY